MSQLNFHPDCDASRQQSAKDAVAWWESDQSHLTISTSGSTGEPKNIDLNRQGIEASIAATEGMLWACFLGSTRSDSHLPGHASCCGAFFPVSWPRMGVGY